MNPTLTRALVILIPTSAVFGYSVLLFIRSKGVASALQLFGAAGFMIVVLAHICEAVNLLPRMGWGLEHSPGHYLDLTSAVLGITLFVAGILLNRLSKPPAAKQRGAEPNVRLE